VANNEQNDKELNDYLDGNSDVSKTYRASNSSEPSSSLDDAILLAAKEAIENTERKIKPSFHKSRWTVPISIAAMVTLSVSLVVTMQQEVRQPLISEPEVEMFGAAALSKDVLSPQVISADSVPKQELKSKNNNENNLYDTVSNEAALGAVGDYRAPINPAGRVKVEVMQRFDKNENIDEVRTSAAGALGTVGGYSEMYENEASVVKMKEHTAKKTILKQKTEVENLEKRDFASDEALSPVFAKIEFDEVIDIKRARQLNKTSEVDLASEIIKLIETGKNVFFVHVGESTLNKLVSRRGIIKECSIIIESGDIDVIGNGEATNIAYIRCPEKENLGLRIKIDDSNNYHVLGFWIVK